VLTVYYFRFSIFFSFRPSNLKIHGFEPSRILTIQNQWYDRGKPKFAQITRDEIYHEGPKQKYIQITRTKTKKYNYMTENQKW